MELIKIENVGGELLADSRMVANVLGVEHDSVSKIIRDKETTLGVSRFEIGKPGDAGGRPEKYFLLTERQCLLLITMGGGKFYQPAIFKKIERVIREKSYS